MDVHASTPTRARRDAPAVRLVAPLVVVWIGLAGTFAVLSVVPHGGALEAVRQAAYLIPFWAAAISSAVALRDASGDVQRLLRALAVSITFVAIAETAVSVRVLSGMSVAAPHWPVVSEVLTVAAAVLMIGALARSTDLRAYSRLARIRHVVDAVGVAVAVSAAILLALVAFAERGVMTPHQAVAAALYSGLGTLLLIAAAANFGLDPGALPQAWFRRVLVGLLLYAAATIAWPVWLYGAVIKPGSAWEVAIELAWMSGMSLATGGLLSRAGSPSWHREGVKSMPRGMPRSHAVVSIGLSAGLTLAAAAMFLIGMSAATREAFRPAVVGFAGALALLVAVRQVLASIENGRLLEALSTDPVTGLHAYRPFQEALQTEIDRADRAGGTVALVMFDIDGFRCLNESDGHAAGDALLKAAGQAIAGSVRSSDIVGRLGSDEFAVVMGGASYEQAERAAIRALSEIRALGGVSRDAAQATAGIAIYPLHAGSRAELMRCAAGALFWAKRHDRGGFAVYDPQVVKALDAKEEIEQLESETQVRAIRALAVAVDARDAATQFHSKNVALLVTEIAHELGLPPDQVTRLEIAALLHDVGKIGVSDRVLRKRSPLTAAEMMHVREHSVLGERILRSSGFEDIAHWVRHHHERFDGTGYPDGLSGERIPLEARLLALCDAFDAMTSDRPYRSAMSPVAALHEIDCCIGSQFDPEIAEAFIELMGRRLRA